MDECDKAAGVVNCAVKQDESVVYELFMNKESDPSVVRKQWLRV
jgi:hypothetical protein